MNLNEKIDLRDMKRDALKRQEEVVADYRHKAELYAECVRMLEKEAEELEAKLDRELEKLTDMERDYNTFANDVYNEGVAQHGTFDEAFDCNKYFDGLKKLYKDGAFFKQP